VAARCWPGSRSWSRWAAARHVGRDAGAAARRQLHRAAGRLAADRLRGSRPQRRRPLAVEARGFAELYEQRRPLYHATADALVDAERLEGGEPLLVPLSRPAALSELPRLVGRAGGWRDRRPKRVRWWPRPRSLRHVRLPWARQPKTVAVGPSGMDALADLGLEAATYRRPGRRARPPIWAASWPRTYQRACPGSRCDLAVGMVDAAIGARPASTCPDQRTTSALPSRRVGGDRPRSLETLRCGSVVRLREVIRPGCWPAAAVGDGVRSGSRGRGSTEQRLELIRRCAHTRRTSSRNDPRTGTAGGAHLGHSIGHAIEAAAGFTIPHAGGRVACCKRSGSRRGLRARPGCRARDALAAETPRAARGAPWGGTAAAVRERLSRDKKARSGGCASCCSKASGRPVWGVTSTTR